MAPPKRCLEIFVQIAAMFASGGAMTAAILTQLKYNNLYLYDEDYESDGYFMLDELGVETNAMTGLVFASTWVAIVLGITRIISAKNDESNQGVFSCLYLGYLLLCVLGFAAAGILGAFVANNWFHVQVSPILIIGRIDGSVDGRYDLKELQNSVAATSALSLLAALLYGVLEIVLLHAVKTDTFRINKQ